MGDADQEALAVQLLEIMQRVQPDVIIAFGPMGLSHHVDHIAMYQGTLEAFTRYRKTATKEAIYYFWALTKEVTDGFELDVDGVEIEPHVAIDVSDTWASKIQALRMYASQEDAQEIAEMLENFDEQSELFHQAYPPVPPSALFDDLFHA
jgi:LmbE family N-acetylglucosaminyl deacetylase